MNERMIYKHYSDMGYSDEETEEILMNQSSDSYDESVDNQAGESK